MRVKVAQSCPTLQPLGLYSPWNSPGQNTGVGSFSLLQGIFPIQGSNPGLPHCRQILYQLSHQGSPGILEWVVYPFSSRSNLARNRTRVSGIAAEFFTSWATREAIDSKAHGNHYLVLLTYLHNSQVWPNLFYLSNLKILIYLTALDLSYSTRDLFIVACGVFSCGMWDLAPWLGIEPRPPALGAQTVSYGTTREVPRTNLF